MQHFYHFFILPANEIVIVREFKGIRSFEKCQTDFDQIWMNFMKKLKIESLSILTIYGPWDHFVNSHIIVSKKNDFFFLYRWNIIEQI